MKKTIKFIIILILLSTILVSCGSDPAVPSGNNNNGSNNNSNTNTNTEKTICYIYQYDLTAPTGGPLGNNINDPKNEYRNFALKASFKNDNNEDKEYLFSFCDGLRLFEKDPDSNTYYAYVGNNSVFCLIERYSPEADLYLDYGSNPTNAEKELEYIYRNLPKCPAHWGIKVKIGETEDRIFYAIAPIYQFDGFTDNLSAFSDNLQYKDVSPKFYAYCNNYESVTYIETVNGIEFYNSDIQKGDEVCFRAIDENIVYFNPELNKSFTFDEMTSHILNSSWRNAEYQENHFNKNTILEQNTWICEGFFDWYYVLEPSV